MKLSILDQSPISEGSNAEEALRNSIDLARHADRLGYERYWIAEHHGLEMIATSAPEIMIAVISQATQRIRVGSGAVLLPHYSPLKVAEVFRTLHALAPGRIDLGIGRAPGGEGLDALALRRKRDNTPFGDDFPNQVAELTSFLEGTFPDDHPFQSLRVVPEVVGGPEIWMLGSSMWSGVAAGQYGMPYAFAHFIAPPVTGEAMEVYRARFLPSPRLAAPRNIVALGVVCGEDDAQAERIASGMRAISGRIARGQQGTVPTIERALAELEETPYRPPESEWPRLVVGGPKTVRATLEAMAEAVGIDEIMALTIVHDHAARVRSYELLAGAFGL